MAFFAVVACLSFGLVAGNPYPSCAAGSWGAGSWGSGAGGSGGMAGGRNFAPIIIEQVAPAPITVGLPLTPNVIDHQSAPYEINYFGTPYVVKHKQSAALNVYTQTPVVVDTYAEPKVQEHAAEPAVIVEEICPCSGPNEIPCH
ncbi:unnamed protein product [Bemisia tabaci]|uniref:Uncharacterized protein n=1 Tax=Bemisia tabaci TaxID=7038 RepID=A0A9P0CCM0_BEMTA|nr:unnamed protein product [Bemisia tabaci]